MSSREDEADLKRTSPRTIQRYLERSLETIVPFVRNETAQAHCHRIMELLDSERGNANSLCDISKDLILTLLQCAARVYEGDSQAKEEAMGLIKCREFRIILSVGMQDNLLQALHDHVASTGPELTIENGVNVGLLSATRDNKACQMDDKSTLIEQIASLCCNESGPLQNIFESAKIDEAFMFHNYLMLVDALSLLEKSWLANLLPHIFQWSDEGSGDAKVSEHLVARYGVPFPVALAPYTLDNTDPTDVYNNGEASNIRSVSSRCASPNSEWGFPDEDDAVELFPFSPEPYGNVSTNKMTLPPPSDPPSEPSNELQGSVRPLQACSAYLGYPTATSDDEKTQQQASTSVPFDARADGELSHSLSNMTLKVEYTQACCEEKLQFLDDPALMKGGLKGTQDRATEHCKLAMAAVETNDRRRGRWRGAKVGQVFATIPEESQEQRVPQGS